MFVELKHKTLGRVLFSGNYDSPKRAVEACVRAGTSLDSVDLTNYDLRDADLRTAVLSNAKMTGAKLDGAIAHNANFSSADLTNGSMIGFKASKLTKTGLVTTNCDTSGSRF
jgi:uncharacterized protein YjbI with pentapeptide repeats